MQAYVRSDTAVSEFMDTDTYASKIQTKRKSPVSDRHIRSEQ
jgi:hypothetical protein